VLRPQALDIKAGARGLLLWPGVAMMAVDSLAQLALTTLCSAKPLRLGGADAEDVYEYGEYGGKGSTAGGGLLAAEGPADVGDRERGGGGGGGGGGHTPGAATPRGGRLSVDGRGAWEQGERGERRGGGGRVALDDHPDTIPAHWWVVGISVAGTCTVAVLHTQFGLALWQPVLAWGLSRTTTRTRGLHSLTFQLNVSLFGGMGRSLGVV